MEAEANRVSLDLRRKIRRGDFDLGQEIHKIDFDLGRAIHKVKDDLRDEFRGGLREHTGELESLRFLSNFHGGLLKFLVVVLICSLCSADWWTGTMYVRVRDHDRRLGRIEEASAIRADAIDLRLNELNAAIRQEQTTPAR